MTDNIPLSHETRVYRITHPTRIIETDTCSFSNASCDLWNQLGNLKCCSPSYSTAIFNSLQYPSNSKPSRNFGRNLMNGRPKAHSKSWRLIRFKRIRRPQLEQRAETQKVIVQRIRRTQISNGGRTRKRRPMKVGDISVDLLACEEVGEYMSGTLDGTVTQKIVEEMRRRRDAFN